MEIFDFQIDKISFANPNLAFLLAIPVGMLVWYFFKHSKSTAELQISSFDAFKGLQPSLVVRLRHSLPVLRSLLVATLILMLMRPQSTDNWNTKTTEGIDIMLALDISSSMLAQDFKPNRLEAAKDVAIKFIAGRELDRMGLVVFSGESFTQCPLTTDHAVLINLFAELKSGLIEDGTAIGMGLATAVNRLRDSKAISKVIILLTDGVNNQGEVSPSMAAELAEKFNIRVYTVGMGTMGEAPYPFQTPYGTQYQNVKVEIDEATLKEISKITGGKYFRAVNKKKLQEIYTEINKLEKSKIETKEFSSKEEEFLPLAFLAVFLLALELILRYTVFRKIP